MLILYDFPLKKYCKNIIKLYYYIALNILYNKIIIYNNKNYFSIKKTIY